MDLPFVYQALGAVLESALEFMIWPKQIIIPVADLDPRAMARLHNPAPVGALFVRVVSVSGIGGTMEYVKSQSSLASLLGIINKQYQSIFQGARAIAIVLTLKCTKLLSVLFYNFFTGTFLDGTRS